MFASPVNRAVPVRVDVRESRDRAPALQDAARRLPESLSHREINDSLGLPSTCIQASDAFIASLPARR